MLDDEICSYCGKKDSEHVVKASFLKKLAKIRKEKCYTKFKNIQELRKCIESDN